MPAVRCFHHTPPDHLFTTGSCRLGSFLYLIVWLALQFALPPGCTVTTLWFYLACRADALPLPCRTAPFYYLGRTSPLPPAGKRCRRRRGYSSPYHPTVSPCHHLPVTACRLPAMPPFVLQLIPPDLTVVRCSSLPAPCRFHHCRRVPTTCRRAVLHCHHQLLLCTFSTTTHHIRSDACHRFSAF